MRSKLFQRKVGQPWWSDIRIRIWIAGVFLVRLWGVWNPPFDRFDAWRQSITAMTTRNFLEVDPNIFFPRVDFAGNLSGIIGMEFPIYNWLTAALAWSIGMNTQIDLFARLLNMAVTSVGIFYFYKSVREFIAKDIAFPAAVLLLCSLWMLYSRKIMPDTFAAGLALIGVYHGLKYARDGGYVALTQFICFMLVAILSKISVAFMLIYPPLLMYRQGFQTSRRMLTLAMGIGVVLVTVSIWYFWWVPALNERYGFQHFFMGRPLIEGFTQIVQNGSETFETFTKNTLGYAGSALLIIGLISIALKRDRVLAFVFIGGMVAFLPFVVKSGFNFYHHKYYVIPFVPVLCVLAGQGVQLLKRPGWRWILAMIFSVFLLEQTARLARDLSVNNDHLLGLSKTLNAVSDPQDLILINSGDDPTLMYFADRKGWVVHPEQLKSASYLRELELKGLKFVVLVKSQEGKFEPKLRYPIVHQDEYFLIYRVGSEAAPDL